MKEQAFTFLMDRPSYYDLLITFIFLFVFFIGFSLKLNSTYWVIALSILIVVLIGYMSGRRIKIKVTNNGLTYAGKKNQFTSEWSDIQFIEIANYPSTMGFNDMSHGPDAFRIITKTGTSDWIRPFTITTDSHRKAGDSSNKIGDNFSLLFGIIKEKSGVTPGLGSSFYNRRIN